MTSIRTRLLFTVGLLISGSCGFEWYGGNGNDPHCRDQLCGWEVEQGQAARTATWHPNDYGVALTANPSVVGRNVPVTRSARCLQVSYLSAVEASAGLELWVDYNDDGSHDVKLPLPASDWKKTSLEIAAPADYRRLRLRVAKLGTGLSELAQFAVRLQDDCPGQTALQNGAECSLDATCASQRCVSGLCASCGIGGCAEGEACRADSECIDGACAGGVCRACAKQGSCGAGERCSNAAQCAAHSCIAGSQPKLTSHPTQDATCGDCDGDDDCSGGKCALGRCSECATDADCTGGRVCRYFDTFDASARGCVPKLSSQLPRGALCESDADCQGGLRCGGSAGRAKRCGVACGSANDCAADQHCIAPGAEKTSETSASVSLLAAWNDLAGRIATCYPRADFGQPCSLHQQCAPSFWGPASCCDGACSIKLRDLFSGQCFDRPFY